MNSSNSPNIASVRNPYGVDEGDTPYPEECVFFVAGGLIRKSANKKILLGSASYNVVAPTRKAAQIGFLDQVQTMPATDEQGWEILNCSSLAELRAFTRPRPDEITVLPESNLVKLFTKPTIWMVEEVLNGGVRKIYLSAHSPAAVEEFLSTSGRSNATFVPLESLSNAMMELEAARDGDMTHAFYAVDLSADGEIKRQMRKIWREASLNDREQINARRKRHGRVSYEEALAS
jgi:hypothetical protein